MTGPVDGLEENTRGINPSGAVFIFTVSPSKNQSRSYRDRLKKKGGESLMISAVETTDIFRGGFFLLNGGRLSDVRLGDNNRGIVSFLIEGDNMARLDLDYRTGRKP